MPNQQDLSFNKNVSMVYIEEAGFTGYRGLDFTKLDNIEDILRQGVVISGSLADSANIGGIKINTDSIDSKLFVTGDPYPAGVQGTIVFQADLNPQFDGIVTYQADTAGNGKVVFNNTFVTLPHTGYIKNVSFKYRKYLNLFYCYLNKLLKVLQTELFFQVLPFQLPQQDYQE
jgi:hypothetical protein